MKITIISGTNRPGSNTRKVAAIVEGIYSELGHPVNFLDLAQLPPQIFDPAAYETTPPEFKHFQDVVSASEGLHIVTPEYNSSIPGILKYFIDMLEIPASTSGKSFAFTGLAAGMWGGLHSVEILQQLLISYGGKIFPNRVFIPNVRNVVAEEGEISDESILKRLRAQAAGFTDFVG
jgi:chromate reductase